MFVLLPSQISISSTCVNLHKQISTTQVDHEKQTQRQINRWFSSEKEMTSRIKVIEWFNPQIKAVEYDLREELSVGHSYPYNENLYLEFKSGHDSTPWKMAAFCDAFREFVPKTIAAFINTRIAYRKRPKSPCLLVFGVMNNDRTITGIEYNPLLHGTTENLEFKLQESARLQLCHVLDHGRDKSLPSLGERIASAVKVNIKQLASSGTTATRAILITVSLTFDDNFDVTVPSMIRSADSLFCYFRRFQSETITLDADSDEFYELFPYGCTREFTKE